MRSLLILVAVCAMASSAPDRYGGGGVNVVDYARPNNGQGQNIDPGYSQPTYFPGGGPQRPDISPAWVQNGNGGNGNNDYRGKKFDDPRLRGGK